MHVKWLKMWNVFFPPLFDVWVLVLLCIPCSSFLLPTTSSSHHITQSHNHTSHITHHTSNITRHTSHITHRTEPLKSCIHTHKMLSIIGCTLRDDSANTPFPLGKTHTFVLNHWNSAYIRTKCFPYSGVLSKGWFCEYAILPWQNAHIRTEPLESCIHTHKCFPYSGVL